jgi:Abortive infection C-terminus
MPRELVSRRTQREFQEWLVGWTLRTISDLFDNHNVKFISLPEDQMPSGQRRSLVACHYASIDWSNSQDVRRILDAYEDILIEIPATGEEGKQKLIRYLEKDGYTYDSGRIVSKALDATLVDTIPTVGLDTEHLYMYVNRINASIETDPSLAIGSTKELIEATLKTILNGCGLVYDDKKDDIPKLLKQVQKVLELAPDDVDGSKKGAEIIKRVLSNLGSVAVGIAELRNLYGSGHGKGQKSQGLSSRHAKLVVGSGTTLCVFLLDTYEHRNTAKP